MSEVRGRSREDPMPEGLWPRGVTPRPRSGAAAKSTRLRRRRNGREELPSVRGQRGRPRGDTQCLRSGMATRGVTPRPRLGRRPGGATHARGQGRLREELPRAVAVGAQEGLEELSHIEGQEGWR